MPIGTRPFKATVYNPDTRTAPNGKTYTKCKLRTAKRNRDGSWTNEYWNATIFDVLREKDKIEITEFSLEQKQWESQGQKRYSYDLVVWAFNPIEVAPAPFADEDKAGFTEVEDDGGDTLPF